MECESFSRGPCISLYFLKLEDNIALFVCICLLICLCFSILLERQQKPGGRKNCLSNNAATLLQSLVMVLCSLAVYDTMLCVFDCGGMVVGA